MRGLARIAAATAIVLLTATLVSAQPRVYENATGEGCMVRVNGTSTLHDWTAQSRTMTGKLEIADAAALDAGRLQPGPVTAEMTLTVPASSLRSVKSDGTPFSSGMDKEMHSKLRAARNPNITFKLTRLAFRKRATETDAIVFDCDGDMTVAGVKRRISFPVEVKANDDGSLRMHGQMGMRMTDYKISPPRNMLVLRTGDAVRVEFDWKAAAKTTATE